MRASGAGGMGGADAAAARTGLVQDKGRAGAHRA